MRRVPELERQEIRELYARKGFAGDLLDRIVATITANSDVWVAVMLAEEHQFTPISRAHALRAAFVVGVSAVVGSLIPLLPFVVLPVGTSRGFRLSSPRWCCLRWVPTKGAGQSVFRGGAV